MSETQIETQFENSEKKECKGYPGIACIQSQFYLSWHSSISQFFKNEPRDITEVADA
jgi:hypothetical protein